MLRVAGIVSDSIVDGPGLRLSVFTQGCARHCPGCHNPESHDPLGGEQMPARDIADMVKRNPLLSGITLTGGEPMEQAAACLALVRMLPDEQTVWVYSGYTYEEIIEAPDAEMRLLLDACDVLVDGPFDKEQRSLSLPFRGSRNQRLIDLRKTKETGAVVLLEPD